MQLLAAEAMEFSQVRVRSRARFGARGRVRSRLGVG